MKASRSRAGVTLCPTVNVRRCFFQKGHPNGAFSHGKIRGILSENPSMKKKGSVWEVGIRWSPRNSGEPQLEERLACSGESWVFS